MTQTTHPLPRRIAAGVGISLFSTLTLAAFMVPGGALEGRATSLRIDVPAEVTTTTTMAPVAAESAPVEVTTTTIGEAVVIEAPTTTTTLAPKVAANPSGHFICPAGMNSTTQYDGPDCRADVLVDPGPNVVTDAERAQTNGADGDQPGQTLGSTDAGYGAELTAKYCAAMPWQCGDGQTR